MGDPASARLKARHAAGVLVRRAVPAALVVAAIPKLRRADVAIPLAGLAVWSTAEVFAEHFQSNRAAVDSAQDKGTRQAVLGAHLLAWWLPLAETAVRRPRPTSSGAVLGGATLLAAGAGARIVAVRTLGRYFTGHVQVVAEQPVCDHGVYRYVRHPSYAGLFLLNIAPAVCARAWWSTAAVAAATAASTGARVRVEEQVLDEALGEAYRRYRRQTPRWLPRPGPQSR